MLVNISSPMKRDEIKALLEASENPTFKFVKMKNVIYGGYFYLYKSAGLYKVPAVCLWFCYAVHIYIVAQKAFFIHCFF